jgi:hypothetical protein
MEKIEFKHLVPYLPYGLNMIFEKSGRIIELGGIQLTDACNFIYIQKYGQFYEATIWKFKPILRPLSDLTKEITHNGETFVPMLELAYLMPEYIMVDYNGTLVHYSFQIDDDGNFCITFNSGVSDDMCLSYDKNQMSFYLTIGFSEAMVAPQYDMFQKLFEWHFDVFGLIEKGLAININNLNQ